MQLNLSKSPSNWDDDICNKLTKLGFIIEDDCTYTLPKNWDYYRSLGDDFIIKDQHDNKRIKITERYGIEFYNKCNNSTTQQEIDELKQENKKLKNELNEMKAFIDTLWDRIINLRKDSDC